MFREIGGRKKLNALYKTQGGICPYCKETITVEKDFTELGNKFPHIVTVRKSEPAVTLPDRKPLAMGENGTKPILCARQYGITASSTPRSSME